MYLFLDHRPLLSAFWPTNAFPRTLGAAIPINCQHPGRETPISQVLRGQEPNINWWTPCSNMQTSASPLDEATELTQRVTRWPSGHWNELCPQMVPSRPLTRGLVTVYHENMDGRSHACLAIYKGWDFLPSKHFPGGSPAMGILI